MKKNNLVMQEVNLNDGFDDNLVIKTIKVESIISMVETEIINNTEVGKIASQIEQMLKLANDRTVTTDLEMKMSGEMQAEIDKRIKEVKKAVDEYRDKSNKLHKGIKGIENKYVKPLEEAKNILRSKNSDYMNEQQRIREELQRKEEERQRKLQIQREKVLQAQREKAIKDGKIEKAKEKEIMIEKLQDIPVAMIPDLPNKLETESGVKIKFETQYIPHIEDPRKVLRAIVEGRLSLDCAELNIKKIANYCKANDIHGGMILGMVVEKKKVQK